MLWFCVTLAHELALSTADGFVSAPPRALPRASPPPSWLKAYAYPLTAIFLTPFFPTLAHPAFNRCSIYHLQQRGGRVPALLPPSVSCSPLSPFPTSLTQKQGGTEYRSYQPSSGSPFRYLITSSLRSFFSLFQVQWKHPFPVFTGEKP